jgi:hypothetical protein
MQLCDICNILMFMKSYNRMRYRCGWLFLCAPQIQAGIGAAPDRYGRPLRAPYRCGSTAGRTAQIQYIFTGDPTDPDLTLYFY